MFLNIYAYSHVPKTISYILAYMRMSYGQYKMNRCITIIFFKVDRCVSTATFLEQNPKGLTSPIWCKTIQSLTFTWTRTVDKGKCGYLSNQTRKSSVSVVQETCIAIIVITALLIWYVYALCMHVCVCNTLSYGTEIHIIHAS